VGRVQIIRFGEVFTWLPVARLKLRRLLRNRSDRAYRAASAIASRVHFHHVV